MVRLAALEISPLRTPLYYESVDFGAVFYDRRVVTGLSGSFVFAQPLTLYAVELPAPQPSAWAGVLLTRLAL